MRYLFQSTCKLISHRNEWSFRVYMILLQNLVSKLNSRPCATTWVNSRRSDSRCHDIFWWYDINKCRAMRGDGSEFAPARLKKAVHVNCLLTNNCEKQTLDDVTRISFTVNSFIRRYHVYQDDWKPELNEERELDLNLSSCGPECCGGCATTIRDRRLCSTFLYS